LAVAAVVPPRLGAAGMSALRLWFGMVSAVTAAALLGASWLCGWQDRWSTPDQRGPRLMGQEPYAEEAAALSHPKWHGIARSRAGDLKRAGQIFGGLDTAASAYVQGNALVMQGKYDEAVARYDRALALRPGWADAEANRALARLRGERLRNQGGDLG